MNPEPHCLKYVSENLTALGFQPAFGCGYAALRGRPIVVCGLPTQTTKSERLRHDFRTSFQNFSVDSAAAFAFCTVTVPRSVETVMEAPLPTLPFNDADRPSRS
jgi:hypothetical protein